MSNRGVVTFSLLPTIARELFSKRTLPRVPEPEVMDDPTQVSAYAEAGVAEGMMAAGYVFHTARITQVIQGCKYVLDLGCGPGTQLCDVAELHPHIEFCGVDLSEEMLEHASAHAAARGLRNVSFRRGDMSQLDGFADHSVDGVISTLTLHHLPSYADLERCFASIARVNKPDGALYLADFIRLKSARSVEFLAGLGIGPESAQFMNDFEMSMRAAFLKEELEGLRARYLAEARSYATFMVSFLAVIKTPDRPLSNELRALIHARRAALSPRDRRDLDGLRYLLAAGGLENDPYRFGLLQNFHRAL